MSTQQQTASDDQPVSMQITRRRFRQIVGMAAQEDRPTEDLLWDAFLLYRAFTAAKAQGHPVVIRRVGAWHHVGSDGRAGR